MSKFTITTSCRLFWSLLLICCTVNLNAQNLDWAKAFGNNTNVRKTAVDTAGNIYLTGSFYGGPTDFDPGPAVTNLTPVGADIFLLKLDASGAFVWVKHFQGEHADGGGEATDITLDSLGNIYLSGIFGSFLDNDPYNIDFDPGSGVANLTSTGADYIDYYVDRDIFVTKLDPAGALLWAKKIAGAGAEQVSSLCTDHEGSVLLTGSFDATVDFNPGPAVNNLTPSGIYDADVFICKLSSEGNYAWVKQFGGPNSAITSITLKTDESNHIYTMGYFRDTVDFDPGSGVQYLTTELSAQGWDIINIFISKLDANGNYLWAKNMGNLPPGAALTDFIQPKAMVTDAFGNLFIAGFFSDTTDADPGSGINYLYPNGTSDAFIIKLDTAGSFGWAKSFGGTNYEGIWSLETDAYGNVYTLGSYRGLVDFDPSDTGTHIITSPTAQGGLFISKFDSLGSFNWVAPFDAMSNSSIGMNGTSLALNPADLSLYVASAFSGTVDFDPGADTFNITAPDGNAFVLRLRNCLSITSSLSITSCDSFNLNGVTYTQSGTYQQTFAAANGCDSVVHLNLTINQPPVATVTQSGNTLNAVNSGAIYQWIDCNNANAAIPGANQQSFSPAQNGRYAVVVDLGGCSDTSDCVVITGITDISPITLREATFRLYPNPTQGNVTIAAGRPLKNATVKIINLLGQVITQKTKQAGTHLMVDLKHVQAGVYFIELSEGNDSRKFKVVKQ